MEVKTPRPANQFWPRFFRSRLTLVLLVQAVIFFLMTGALAVISDTDDSPGILIVCGGFFIIAVIVNVTILYNVTRPTKNLMGAITKLSGEKTNLTPPNPNSDSMLSSGLGDALKTIYELASKNDSDKPATKSNDISDIAIKALDKSSCGFIAMDKDHRVIYANKTAPVHTNEKGDHVIDLLFDKGDSLDDWLDDQKDNEVRAEKVWRRIADRPSDVNNRRLFDVVASYEEGATPQAVLTLVDRTNVYAKDEEDLNFVAFAAHELRGPITVIRGYLDVLNDELEPKLEDDQQELFHRLIISANRLSSYINNILNTSKYDSRHLKMQLLEGKVVDVYAIIKDDMAMRAKAQNRLLSVNIPDDLPTVAVDLGSMSEVFGNLIDNAIKYSNEGGLVNVTAKADGDFVDFSVEDHGVGMPPGVVGQLFHKFYRSHRSRETVAGTGIGLYISKAIVESHGGTITVKSEDGRGSIFNVSIPIFATVADKIAAAGGNNLGLISEGKGWIKNHSMYRG